MVEDPNFFAPYTTISSIDADGNPRALNVLLEKYCSALASYMQRSRGTGLPGILSTKTVRTVFRQLSLPWAKFAEGFGEECFNTTYTFLELAIMHVAGPHTGDALLRAYVYPRADGEGFDSRRTFLEAKINELLWPYNKSHPMTYHSSYNTKVNSDSQSQFKARKLKWVDLARSDNRFSVDMVHAADALDKTEDYYDVCEALVQLLRVMRFHRRFIGSGNKGSIADKEADRP